MKKSRFFPSQFFYLIAAALLLLFLNSVGAFGSLRGLVERWLVIPTKEVFYRWPRKFQANLDQDTINNDKEMAALKAEIVALKEENLQQRRLLSAPLPKNWQFLPVKVIGLEGESLVINAGKNQGVAEGMIAVSGNLYLGRIASVGPAMAKLNLPTMFEERLQVKIASAAAEPVMAQGLLVGRGEGKMRVEQILASEKPAAGDLVLTNIEGGTLLVGEISEVIAVQGEVFQTAEVKSLFIPEELGTIFLIRGAI